MLETFEIRVPKVPFRVFDKLKNKIQKFMIIFCFYLEHYSLFTLYVLHVIQKQVRVKSPEIFRCTMVTRTPRIRCLENS